MPREPAGAPHLGSQEVALVAFVARSMARRLWQRPDPSDLESLGLLVACDAALCHDPTRGDFEPYLVGRLRWAMISEARKNARRERLLGTQGAPPFGDAEPGERDEEPETAVERSTPESRAELGELRRRLHRALARLDDEARDLLVRHYFGDESLETIASESGQSKARVTRLHHHGLRRLSALMVALPVGG